MLRKSPCLSYNFKKRWLFPQLFKLQNWINLSIFSYLKLFSVFIVNGSTIHSLINMERLKDYNVEIELESSMNY